VIRDDSEVNTDLSAFRNLPEVDEWTFRPIKLKDKKRYEKYIAASEFPLDIWSSNFPYLWAHTRRQKRMTIMRSQVNGMLVTWILTAKGRLYLPCLPVGPGIAKHVIDVLKQCDEFCVKWNIQSGYKHKPIVAKLSSNQIEHFQHFDIFNKLFKPKLLSGVERHLSVTNLISLTGKKFSTIRYKLNKFQREHPGAKLRYYQSTDYDSVVKLGQKWKETAGTKHRRILDDFYFKATIKHHHDLGLENLVVELDGNIIGITTGGVLPTGQAWGYLTKFDNSYEGISEYLVVAMAQRIRELNSSAELINIGTDFGNEQLAMAKEKFRPVKTYQRYALISRRTLR
jgi:hypothetical protein